MTTPPQRNGGGQAGDASPGNHNVHGTGSSRGRRRCEDCCVVPRAAEREVASVWALNWFEEGATDRAKWPWVAVVSLGTEYRQRPANMSLLSHERCTEWSNFCSCRLWATVIFLVEVFE
jgi:hypothetical protein